MLLSPQGSSNIYSPLLSESRWNRIKLGGNEGNTFESYGLTGLGWSQTSYNVAGAVFDICVAISVCSRRVHLSWPTWSNILTADWDPRDLEPFDKRPGSDVSCTNSRASWQRGKKKKRWGGLEGRGDHRKTWIYETWDILYSSVAVFVLDYLAMQM